MVNFYVLLGFDGLSLLIPQHEVRVVEIIEDVELHVEPEEAAAGVMGWISQSDQQFPVFTLNARMDLCSFLPETRQYCVLLETEEEAVLGITCDEVISLDDFKGDLHLQPIPPSMHLDFSPLSGLGLYEERMVCTTDASSLMGYLTAHAEEQIAQMEEETYDDPPDYLEELPAIIDTPPEEELLSD
ncbi:MAG: hypothetical protein RIT27_1164 [Pseudomonadota bacterium]|jgi:chemotaxis signal transduction protein